MTTESTDGLLLAGLGIGGYRSLRELQTLGRLRKVTLVAGRNNSGKSNILRFAAMVLAKQVPPLDWLDEPQPPGPPLRLQVAHPPVNVDALAQIAPQLQDPRAIVELFTRGSFHPVAGDEVWLTYSFEGDGRDRNQVRRWSLDDEYLRGALRDIGNGRIGHLRQASSDLTSRSGGAETEDLRRVLETLFPFAPPTVRTVGAFRQISAIEASTEAGGPTEPEGDDYSGRNLIQRLAALESPPAQRYHVDRAKFDAINQFARTVLEDNDVSIRIPVGRDVIQVHQDGRVLPLASLGTGIHQVIILAAAATLLENTLVCIEEPEVHLHPLLQRKLVRYLSDATTNQYLIATHSAHLLDYERAAILHVKHDPIEGTQVTEAATVQAVSDLCGDLGYRPSDLIQANAVLWVEGPSDRLYLNHWLKMVAQDEFLEGIHYSVMFYGGGLLRHLTANDPSVDEFISLRRLNRHSAILIDSDKASPSGQINATKRRVLQEFEREDMPGFAWVTACRTIENYVPPSVLGKAVAEVHPAAIYQQPSTKWENPLHLVRRQRGKGIGLSATGSEQVRVAPDKVKVARMACAMWPPAELPLDLPTRMAKVVEFIRIANGSQQPLPSPPTI